MSEAPTYRVEFIDGASRISFTSKSSILRADGDHPSAVPVLISAATAEVYGSPHAPGTIRIGNGGLGPTGLLRLMCEAYLSQLLHAQDSLSPQDVQGLDRPSGLKIEWVANHSRHTQAALQGGVVDVALTYERAEEDRAEREGWSQRVGLLCHDHFIVAGPRSDPAGLRHLRSPRRDAPVVAFKAIADSQSTFHARGDGSATMHREYAFWSAAGVSPQHKAWYKRLPSTPLKALRRADAEGAYLITDRATFLFAYNAGEVRSLEVFVEGGEELLNPCSIILRSDERREEVWKFVEWLRGPEAQAIVERYGTDWEAGVPLVTPISRVEVAPRDEFARGLEMEIKSS